MTFRRFSVTVLVLIAAGGCSSSRDPGMEDDAGGLTLPDTGVLPDAGMVPMMDAGLVCGIGETRCESGCARVDRDNANCGSCGNVCPEGVSCASASCSCTAPMLACDGVCIDPM